MKPKIMSEYHSLSRELYGEPFAMFLNYMNFSHYGQYEGKDDEIAKRLDSYGDYEDDTFSIKPFCWCEICDGEGKEGETCPRNGAPNFHYKPKDFKLHWYKYPIRGNNTNKDITPLEFLDMINDCSRSFFDFD